MNSRINLLIGLALAQLVIIGVFWLREGGDPTAAQTLVSFSAEAVATLAVDDGDTTVEIKRAENGWQVAGVAADTDKVDSMLAKLAALDAPWPVASTADSVERFEVADGNYQRRVRLLADGTSLAEFYLGTSPGYQRVHARAAGSDDVYSVQLSNFELSVDTDGWLDKGVLAVAEAPVKVVAELGGDRTEVLEKGDEGWLYNNAAADADAAQTYANRFTTLNVLGLAADAAAAEALATIEVGAGAQARTYRIARLPAATAEDEGDYVINVAEQPQWYRLAAYVAEQLLMTDAEFAAAAAGAAEEISQGPAEQQSDSDNSGG